MHWRLRSYPLGASVLPESGRREPSDSDGPAFLAGATDDDHRTAFAPSPVDLGQPHITWCRGAQRLGRVAQSAARPARVVCGDREEGLPAGGERGVAAGWRRRG